MRLRLATAFIGGVVFVLISEANSVFSDGLIVSIRRYFVETGWISELAVELLTGAVLVLAGLFIGNGVFRLLKGRTAVRRVLSAVTAGLLSLVAGALLGFLSAFTIWISSLMYVPYPRGFEVDKLVFIFMFYGACFSAGAGLVFGSGLIQRRLKLDSEA